MVRKKHSKELKARIVLDAVLDVFIQGKDKEAEKQEVEQNRLYKKVGQFQIEVDWLKKKTGYLG